MHRYLGMQSTREGGVKYSSAYCQNIAEAGQDGSHQTTHLNGHEKDSTTHGRVWPVAAAGTCACARDRNRSCEEGERPSSAGPDGQTGATLGV